MEFNDDTIILQGFNGIAGFDKESMIEGFELNMRGSTYKSQFNNDRNSVIIRYNAHAKVNMFTSFQGFLEIDEDGRETKFKLDRDHRFIPGVDFYTHKNFIVTVSHSEIGVYDMDTREFRIRNEVGGECSTITGLKNTVYVSCLKNNNESTLYTLDLNTFALEKHKELPGLIIDRMIATEQYGIVSVSIVDSNYYLTQIGDEIHHLMKLKSQDSITVVDMDFSDNTIYLLQETSDTYFLLAYNVNEKEFKEKKLEENEIGFDVSSDGNNTYLLINVRGEKPELHLINKDLKVTASYKIETGIYPIKVILKNANID